MIAHQLIAPADTDILVIGAGLNGLACAIQLAQAKQRVTVLEAQDRPGGLMQTSEIVQGFRVSRFAHWFGPMDARVLRALKLQKFGLTIAEKRLGLVALATDDRPIVLDGNPKHAHRDLMRHSARDAKNWTLFEGQARRIAAAMAPWLTTPPLAAQKRSLLQWRDAAGAVPPVAALEAAQPHALRSIAQWLESEFESPLLQGALAFDAVLGSGRSPRAAGTAFSWLSRLALEPNRMEGLMVPQGGMGALSTALAKSAQSHGVNIRLKAKVARILVTDEVVEGVELEGGERVYSPVIVSSLDPATTFAAMAGPRALPFGLKRNIMARRTVPGVAKVNLALSGLPSFKGLEKKDLRARLLFCPSIEYLQTAYQEAAQGQLPRRPALDVIIPSLFDSGLAPANQHVLSAIALYLPATGLGRAGWEAAKDDLLKTVIETLSLAAPNLPAKILASEILGPVDFDRSGIGATWGMGPPPAQGLYELPVDLRSAETPIEGLFLCGEGVHPGSGAHGLTGQSAAAAVLAGLAFKPSQLKPAVRA